MSATRSVSKSVVIAYWLLVVLATLAVAVGAVVLLNGYLVRQYGPAEEALGQIRARQFAFYPYSGTHLVANQRHTGPMHWENQTFYTDFDVSIGDHGFFVDFDLEASPPKDAKEFRILLVGGSCAQGWGGRTNREMFYSYLERQLNERWAPTTGLRYRVVNLAMAGSITYQNYIALNIWGHRLEPDLIISWSGGNDLFVPLMTESDAYFRYFNVPTALNKPPASESPPVAAWLDSNLPGIAAYTNAKNLLQALGFDIEVPRLRREHLAREAYASGRNFRGKDAVFEVSLPTYVHALKSIKRDFRGIPMLVMFQAIDWRQAYPFLEPEYARFTNTVEDELKTYINDKWFFMNMHDIWNKEHLFSEAEMFYGLHLPSHLQSKVADRVVQAVPERFWRRHERRP